MTKIIQDIAGLKKRLDWFLNSDLYGRKQARVFLDDLSNIGEITIFGGMLRDLSITGNLEFKSDIDVVIDIETSLESSRKFQSLISNWPVKRNKFGGYRISLSNWKLDVWRLKDTWAFKNYHVKCEGFESLCKTTFFNWDAIIYHYKQKKIVAIENYIDSINQKVLDINLLETPNDMAIVVKALRYQEMYNVVFSPRLAHFLYNVVKDISFREVYEYEKRSHDWPVLEELYVQDITRWLVEHNSIDPCLPFSRQYFSQKSIK